MVYTMLDTDEPSYVGEAKLFISDVDKKVDKILDPIPDRDNPSD